MARGIATSRLFVVDAFTSKKYKNLLGNPAGVLVTRTHLEDELAVEIAKKLALPALAVVCDSNLFEKGPYPYVNQDLPIRWLGPSGLFLPLCGHATMATSLLLFKLYPDLQDVQYVAAKSGKRVAAKRTERGAAIAFPAADRPQSLQLLGEEATIDGLLAATSLQREDITYLGESRSNDATRANLLVELRETVELGKLAVDPQKLLALPFRGFWLTTPGSPGDETIDMETRVFFPSVGIPEDHVCGSAHTLFGPYWASKRALSQTSSKGILLTSRQVSPRGGLVEMEWDGKFGQERGICWLAGEGIIQSDGQLDADSLP